MLCIIINNYFAIFIFECLRTTENHFWDEKKEEKRVLSSQGAIIIKLSHEHTNSNWDWKPNNKNGTENRLFERKEIMNE